MKIKCFFTKGSRNSPPALNKLALVKLGFSLFKQMHISGFVPQTHKGLICPETLKWYEGLSVHVQTYQGGQRVGTEPLVSLGACSYFKSKYFTPCSPRAKLYVFLPLNPCLKSIGNLTVKNWLSNFGLHVLQINMQHCSPKDWLQLVARKLAKSSEIVKILSAYANKNILITFISILTPCCYKEPYSCSHGFAL